MQKVTLKIPKSWKNDECLDSQDIANLFNLSCSRITNKMLHEGRIPAPDVKDGRKNFWTVKHLRKYEGRKFNVQGRTKRTDKTPEQKRNEALAMWGRVINNGFNTAA